MKKLTYSQVGDNYEIKDPILRLTQKAAKSTAKNLKKSKFREVTISRGESAFVWDQGNCYMALVLECLGTKNLIADEMRKITGKTYYDIIAHDTVATFINDLTTVGAKPLVVNAYWAIEDNVWMQDVQKMQDFVNGWKDACNLAGATWGGGETSTLKGIIAPNTADLAGTVVGIITPKKRYISEKKLQHQDRIILLKSNGINANGISLARKVARILPDGYATKIKKNLKFGQALLTKTNIYAFLIQELLDNGIDIHYIVNITGHGLRKLMRAKRKYTYVLEKIFKPQDIFLKIQKATKLKSFEMYQTFNMGMDYAIFLSPKDVVNAQKIIHQMGFECMNSGYVTSGERQVIIKPVNVTYRSDSYRIKA